MNLDAATTDITTAGHFLAARGWAPATAGNYSVRLDAQTFAVTVSGKWKGELTADDIMTVDMNGRPSGAASVDKKPSDETLLHCAIYQHHPHASAILHTHSVPNTVLSRVTLKPSGSEKSPSGSVQHTLTLAGYELLKAIPGITTHDAALHIPILDNTQDIPAMAAALTPILRAQPNLPAFLIAGHGLYAWAADMNATKKLVEALEFMLSCELETLKSRSAT
jgi:methylthioribulose-1-phosphate dehydratase